MAKNLRPSGSRVLDIVVDGTATESPSPRSVAISCWQAIDLLQPGGYRFYSSVRVVLIHGASCPSGVTPLLYALVRSCHTLGSIELALAVPNIQSVDSGALEHLATTVCIITNILSEVGELRREPTAIPSTLSGEVSVVCTFVACRKVPHQHSAPYDQDDYIDACKKAEASHGMFPRESAFVIPTMNEAKALPSFLESLSACANYFSVRREFIFVINGCTDESESIVRSFVNNVDSNIHIVHSSPGILAAFIAGVGARRTAGFVGKLDADIVVDPFALDLMEIHLVTSPETIVTYAEPLTKDDPTLFNVPTKRPEALSKRLYYTGKASLYRTDPTVESVISNSPANFATEDIPLSFHYLYQHGIGAIQLAPGACVYEKSVATMDDFVSQVWRSECEVERVLESWPQFALLGAITKQDIFDPSFRKLTETALRIPRPADGWTRLETTK